MGVSGLGREGADTPTRDVNAANAVKFRTAPQIAQRAADLVGGDRDREHGKKKQNFDNIAAMWNGYLGIRRDKAAPLDAVDVGHMMVAMKIARTQSGALNVDDYVDAAGYAACAGEVAIGLAPVVVESDASAPSDDECGCASCAEPKFNVGDRVRWRSEKGGYPNGIFFGTVEGFMPPNTESGDGPYVRVKWDPGFPRNNGGYYETSLERVSTPKFKVGDRVRCTCSGCRTVSQVVGRIQSIDSEGLRVLSESVEGWITSVAIDDAELAP